ncbi:MAG: tetratricopeptide repeat protein [Burkholderiaceae bacterium]|nr:tetratricopeptide repeat protein [Burkholderiaceae bacterium]
MNKKIKNFISLFLFSLLCITSSCFADEVADINKLLKDGKTVEAMQKVEAALAQKPKDPHLRFLKGLMLAEQNKSAEAIAIFLKLTDDHPELPEPYNNLAVLYGASGQYDKARAALEMAIRTNPTYGTAHENLGDVYAKLASQAYDKALQLDSANSAARLKLTLVRNLIGNTTGGTNPKTVAANTPNKSNNTSATESVKTSATTKKVDQDIAKSNAKPASKPAPAVNTDQDDILKTVNAWANAWSSKNTTAYLTHYAKDFETPNNVTRKAWAEERRQRIEGKGRIDVKIESPKVALDGARATVKFRQIYSSDRLTANSRKTLDMVKQDGKWLIKQERAGS